MSLYDALKDVIKVARNSGNIELYKQLLDLGSQALELQEENANLKSENDNLKQVKDIESKVVRHEEPYITLIDDENEIMYCSRCWDVDRILVQERSMDNGKCRCPNCENVGVYEKKKKTGYYNFSYRNI